MVKDERYMTAGCWMVVWVIVGVLQPPTWAHSTHRDPYLDPDSYGDPAVSLRNNIPSNQIEESLCDDLAIQVKGGKQRAIDLARHYGLEYLDQVFEDPAVFHLRKHRSISQKRYRTRRHISKKELVEAIAKEPGVEWVNRQIAFTREKRRIPIITIDTESNREAGKTIAHHHKIPADVLKSRTAINKILQNPYKEVRAISGTRSKATRNLHDYWGEDLEIDGKSFIDGNKFDTAKQGIELSSETLQVLRNSFEKQLPSSASNDEMVRIPLSQRNILVRTDDRKEGLGSSYRKLRGLSEGRVYVPRDLQLMKEMKLASKREEHLQEDSQDDDAGDDDSDFGHWIDQLVKNSSLNLNDPLYKDQWYLHNSGQLGRTGYDLNVTWAWLNGYTGRGVVLSVLDDGLQTTNADIAANYAPNVSYSLILDNGPKNDPSPRIDPTYTNSHGTYCAGIMAAVPNNAVCGVGVAYDAKVGGVRLVDGKVMDVQEATALSRHIDQVDVFSASWGPTDDGTKVEGPARLTQHAFVEGVTKGRAGKGVIYVWASGNGGLVGDNCNLDGYTSSIYTLSVSALTDVGTSTFYEEPCASTLASVYVGGEHTLRDAQDRQRRNVKKLRVVVPELDGHCSEDFQGTSAAAPLMAGIVALVLQANGNLTWRDVQHLVVETSSPTPAALQEPGWHTNGHGKHFHLMQGFGAVNAGNMVEAALTWINVKPQKTIIVPMFSGYRDIDPNTWMNVSHVVDSSEVPSSSVMTSVEHVVANVTLSHPLRKFLTIFIISPSGTTSQVLTHRGPDTSNSGFISWGFMSIHFWGEDPQGTWEVAIKDDSGEKGYLKKIELVIYGG